MPDGRLLAAPRALRALEGARAVVFLVGGYDGSGNYGDIAQYEAAAALVSALGPRVVPVAIVEDVYPLDHAPDYDARTAGARGTVLAHFADRAPGADAERVAFTLPPAVRAAAIYLYGGGYLNASWGARKLAMLDAVLDLLRRSGIPRPRTIASGQQVERRWVEALDEPQVALLRSVDPFGVRDAASGRAVAGVARRPVITGDDAVGLLAGHAGPAPASRGAGPLRANVHVSGWTWATADGDALLEFCAALLAGLARRDGLAIQPVVAYHDRQTSEYAAVERLAAACSAHGIAPESFAEPLLLRPATLDGALSRADITLSSSYHVALTSLVFGVPAALMSENDYYAQKAAGLLDDFGLPPAFAPRPGQEPGDTARLLLEGLERARVSVADGAARVVARRLRAEREILGELTSDLVTALAEARTGPAASQIEPDAALELARLQADHQTLLRAELAARDRIAERDAQLEAGRAELAEERELAAARLAEAEARAAALEEAVALARAEQREEAARREEAELRLARVVGSRSWRLTGIARAAARRIRRS